MLSHTMKLWERVIEDRLRKQTNVSSGQFGFMPGKSTMDPIFVLRQLMEKYRRKRKKMHIVFVDLEKAYDKVQREVIWEVLEKKSVSDQYIEVIKDMYKDVRTCLKTVNGMSESFEVRIGVHQGSALSPYLFILVLDELLKGVVKEAPWCMLFADDMGLIGDTAEEVQDMLEKVREALESKGLKINWEKTEHMESKWKGEGDSGDRVKIDDGMLFKKGSTCIWGLLCRTVERLRPK